MVCDIAGLHQGIEDADGFTQWRLGVAGAAAELPLQVRGHCAQVGQAESRVVFVAFDDEVCRISP
jgi:hypothetical protein